MSGIQLGLAGNVSLCCDMGLVGKYPKYVPKVTHHRTAPTLRPPLPRCPPPLHCCHRPATAVLSPPLPLPPPPPPPPPSFRQASTKLPPHLLRCCKAAAATAALPRSCRRRSSAAAKLSPPPSRCCKDAAAKMLPPPPRCRKAATATLPQSCHLLLSRLCDAGLKVNASKSTFCALEIEYLGYVLTRDGIKPQSNKVQAILTIKPPTGVRQLRHFLGMVQYYHDLWARWSKRLAPLTSLVGECSQTKTTKAKGTKKVPWHWDEVHQRAFDHIKATIPKDVVLAYPDYSKVFEIYTDAVNN
jgi:hypothetical protein